MEQISPYSSRLRYLDADDLDDSAVHFGDVRVIGADNHRLGDLDGFVVDSLSGRVQYAVVDSGGWFRSRQFLLPIGHARLDREARAIHVDVTRDALDRYPEYDSERFRAFTDDEMRAFEQRMSVVCCPDDTLDVSAAVQYDTLRHYAQPEWWRSDYHRPERYRELGSGQWHHRPVATRGTSAPPPCAPDTVDRELVTARERRDEPTTIRDAAKARDEDDRTRSSDMASDGGDVSPHVGRRAQPGDVLGIETGGERSHLSDAADDENERRRDAEGAAARLNRD